ncbi:MAG TPA: SCP2 sterol-binding domain-containing protein [Saprospiraceae bacterium]|nr:SCP2 sterol-binding domain-containing protein [Saprospiraceae bacterium]
MTAKEFIYNLPAKVNKDAISGMETVFHFDVEGEGGGQYTLKLKDGTLQVEEGLIGDPKCKVKASNDNLMGVVDGSINPLMALMMGKIKIDNQGELLKYAKIFGLMK